MGNIISTNYIDWKVKPVLKLAERNCYAYRVVIMYEDNVKKIQQKSGFKTKKEAEAARNKTIGELTNGSYIVNKNLKLKDYLLGWMEETFKDNNKSYNTYISYNNVVKNHIIPLIGKKNIAEITQRDVQTLYKHITDKTPSVVRLVKTVMNISFASAVNQKLIHDDVTKGVSIPRDSNANAYHTRNINSKKTLTYEQVQKLVKASENTPIHMQILFNVLMGLRRQEINGVKYADIDYINKTLKVSRQLGTGFDTVDGENSTTSTKKELPLKTHSSYRTLPIPDYVFNAILEERKVYEANRDKYSDFEDNDYICCSNRGEPRSKDYHWKFYKKLLKENDLPDIRWHDLRSTYCTMLLNSNFSPKAISKLMGHAKEIITIDVYGDNKNIIPEEIPELLSYMEDVLPNDNNTEVLEDMIDVSEYL